MCLFCQSYQTPLLVACSWGHGDTAIMLIDQGANISVVDQVRLYSLVIHSLDFTLLPTALFSVMGVPDVYRYIAHKTVLGKLMIVGF